MLSISDIGRQIVEKVRQEGFAGQTVRVVNFIEKHNNSFKDVVFKAIIMFFYKVYHVLNALQNAQIVIEVNGKEETFELFIKKLSSEPGLLRNLIIASNAYKKEVEAYSSVFPFAEKFLREKGAAVESFASYVPRCYLSCYEKENSYIILEDLKTQGFNIGDKYVGFSLSECRLTLQKVAKFHALGYAIRVTSVDNSLKNMFSGILEEAMYANNDPLDFKEGWTLPYLTAIKMVGQVDPDLARKMEKYSNNTFEILCEPYVRSEDPLEVICLGDLWLSNIMFKYGDEGHPIDVRFVDFQILRAASLTLDLSYFFYTSTTTKLRASSYLQLLGEYFETFQQTLVELGVIVPDYLTLEFLEEKMRQVLPSISVLMAFATSFQCLQLVSGKNVPEEFLPSEFGKYSEVGKLDEELQKKIHTIKGYCNAIYYSPIRETPGYIFGNGTEGCI